MNKILYSFWSLLLLASTVLTSSCGSDEDVTPAAPAISLSASNAQGTTVNSGQMVAFVVQVTAPGGFASMKVTKAVGTSSASIFDEVGKPATQINNYNYPFEYTPSSAEAGKAVTFTFEVTDLNGKKNSHDFVITVNDHPIHTYQTVLMGGQSNPSLGSFYNAIENRVYLYAEASANKPKVDFVYYFSTTSQTPTNATIAAPMNTSARNAFTAAGMSLDGMNNQTYFVRMTKAYNEVTTSTGLANAYTESISSTNPSDTRIANLEANQVFAFMLAESRGYRYGIAQVVSVQGTTAGDRKITLNIKIQSVGAN